MLEVKQEPAMPAMLEVKQEPGLIEVKKDEKIKKKKSPLSSS